MKVDLKHNKTIIPENRSKSEQNQSLPNLLKEKNKGKQEKPKSLENHQSKEFSGNSFRKIDGGWKW